MTGEYDNPGPMDTWTVYASSGEYPVPAESAGHAFLRFTERHPDDYVSAIVNDAMRPRLILEDGA
jgi:hypothetical protein